jgi:colanic acid/amylovoran biosynthesis glycosyltransferase
LKDTRSNICFLFTKKFPYGRAETYVHYEIDFLSQAFEKIYIIPVEEFEFSEKRDVESERVIVFNINKSIEKTNFVNKLVGILSDQFLLLKTLIESREKLKCLLTWKLYAKRLIHLRAQGKSLKTFFNKFQLDENIICYHYWLHNSVIIQKLSGITATKTISRAHALDLYHKNWPSIDKTSFLQFEKTKIEYCDLIFSISDHGLKHFYKYFPNFKHKFRLNRLGIQDSYSGFTSKKLLPASINEPHLIVTCSSLNERKRLNLMPEILRQIRTPVKWIHIGGNKGSEIEEIEKIITHCKIQFQFIPQLNSSQIFEFYQSQNIALFCNLSYAEGIPVSLMEAAMFGIPLLATNAFGNPEIVNNENGILVPIDFNPHDVANKIDEIFSQPKLWEKKSQAARRYYLEKYNKDINLNELLYQIKFPND